ncbi:MAG: DNA polymerase III delta prime subunit [Myxococcota bacterium]|jgi:DNA polymerase III delta prime subunit
MSTMTPPCSTLAAELRPTSGCQKDGTLTKNAIVERHEVVRQLLRALRTKRFLILAGLSGTGKTQIARRLAQSAVGIDRQQGSGRGLELLEQSLDNAVEGEGSFLFEPVEGHPEYIRVLDVGTGGKRARALPLYQKRVGFLPVRPDWTDAKKVWGYYNPLTGRFYPTDALAVLLNALRDYMENGDDANNYFLILDEMNLARVEYYFSDLLSLMESGCSLDPDTPGRIRMGEMARVHPLDAMLVSTGQRGVHDQRSEAEAQASYAHISDSKRVMSAARTGSIEQQVPLRELDDRRFAYEPLVKGLEFANRPTHELEEVDEKRHALSVLYPIPPRVAYPPNLTIIGTINVDETTHAFAPKVLDRAFVVEFTDVEYGAAFQTHPLYSQLEPFLTGLHGALSPNGMHFGYRVASEMLSYLEQAGGTFDASTGDFLLLSKVLPKLRGTQHQLGSTLDRLADFTADGGFTRAAAKIERMKAQLRATGFASFF